MCVIIHVQVLVYVHVHVFTRCLDTDAYSTCSCVYYAIVIVMHV